MWPSLVDNSYNIVIMRLVGPERHMLIIFIGRWLATRLRVYCISFNIERHSATCACICWRALLANDMLKSTFVNYSRDQLFRIRDIKFQHP